MNYLNHIKDDELEMVEVDGLLFEEKELLPSASPKNIRVIIDKINMLISYNNSIQEKNTRLQQQVQLAKLINDSRNKI